MSEAPTPPIDVVQPPAPPPALTQRELNQKRRAIAPRDESNIPLVLHSHCHQRAGLDLAYREGVLIIRCKKCMVLVERIAVAP